MLLAKLCAKIKLVAKPLFVLPVRRRAGVAPLVPDANKAGFFAVEKIRVGKIESLHVDDTDQDSLAILMVLTRAKIPAVGIRRLDFPAGDLGLRCQDWVTELHTQDSGVPDDSGEVL